LPETEERQKEKEQKETQKLCGTFKEQKFYENSSACRDYWFDRMIGLKDVQKEIINGFINPAIYPSLFPKRSRGILLYGSPGTGKSLIAKASVNELKRKPGVYVLFYAPTAAELKGKYFGESEKNIRALFECASKAAREVEKQKKADVNNPEQEVKVFAVIFLDEVEAIAGDRSTDTTGLMKTTVNALLQAMNGVDDSLENVSVIAATNYPWQLDSAFLRRFTVSVHVPLPETDDKAELFELEMSNHVNNIVNELDQSKKSQQKQVVDDDKLPVCMRPDNDNRLKWSETKQVLLLPLSGQTAK
jgi:SpoVK/Ycf46/Vps4 family AAA+-type ATPase